MKIANNITELIGKTPLVKINRLAEGINSQVVAKLESFNPLSSVKDRLAFAMIEDAEKRGLLSNNSIIIEPTSGNTGIGLAFVCAVKGYKLLLTMPESMSIERRKLLKSLGAEIVLTPAGEGMNGAIRIAKNLAEENKNAFIPMQFANPANPEIHRKTTALEIWEDTDSKIDIFVAGVGTGGTLTGIGETLKNKNPNIKIVAVEPSGSPVLSGGSPGPHGIQGIGAGFIPEVLNKNIIDEVVTVKNEDAFKTTKALARQEGIFAGISSGAAIHTAITIAKRDENKNKLIVALCPDTGERYLSLDFWEDEE